MTPPESAFTDATRVPLIIGHRGAPGYRPEHTASSYSLALQQGAHAVEPDVVVSRDGVLVIRHENEISTTTDIADRAEFAHLQTTKVIDGQRVTGWFAEDLTWNELQTLRCAERLESMRPHSARFGRTEPMMRLRDLLNLLDAHEPSRAAGLPDARIVIELKHTHFLQTQGYDIVKLLIAELRACGWAERPGQVVVESFELAPLERLAACAKSQPHEAIEARLVFLLETEGAPADRVAAVGHRAAPYSWYRSDSGLDALRHVVNGVSLAKRDLLADPGIVARAHARELEVYTWTLRPENRFLQSEHRQRGSAAAHGDWAAEWRRVLATGVDGVFVDHPDLMVALLSQRPMKSEHAD